MQEKILIIFASAAIVLAAALLVMKIKRPQLAVTASFPPISDGVWYEKYAGERGASIWRAVEIKGKLPVGYDQYHLIELRAGKKRAAVRDGSISKEGWFSVNFSDANWVVPFEPDESFTGTLILQSGGGQRRELSGLFKKLPNDVSDLR